MFPQYYVYSDVCNSSFNYTILYYTLLIVETGNKLLHGWKLEHAIDITKYVVPS